MAVIRFLLAAAAAALLPLGLVGLLSQESLADGAGFAADMQVAVSQPEVNGELKQAVSREVASAVVSAGESVGPLGALAAGLGADGLADAAARAVDTQMFTDALGQWALLLHEGLADYATGTPNSDVTVSGSTVKVGVGELVAPVVGDSPGSLTGLVESVTDGATVTLDTGVNLRVLRALGVLADIAWPLLAGAAGCLLLVVLLGRSRARWLGTALLLSAATTAAAAAVVFVLLQQPAPGADYPAIGMAVTSSLLADWGAVLAAAAAAAALAGLVLVLVGRGTGGRDVAVQRAGA